MLQNATAPPRPASRTASTRVQDEAHRGNAAAASSSRALTSAVEFTAAYRRPACARLIRSYRRSPRRRRRRQESVDLLCTRSSPWHRPFDTPSGEPRMNPLPLLCLLCQDPAPVTTQATPRALDVIELKNGDTLEGRITVDVDGYVEITMGPGETVGFSRAQVKNILRGSGPLVPSVTGTVRPSSEWFVLYDA